MSDAGTAQEAFESLKRNFDMAMQHAAHAQHHINVSRRAYLRAEALKDANILGRAHTKVVTAYGGFLPYTQIIEPCGRGFALIKAGEVGGDELVKFLDEANNVPDEVDSAASSFQNDLIEVATMLAGVAGDHHDVEQARAKLQKAIKLIPMVSEKAAAARTTLENFREAIAS